MWYSIVKKLMALTIWDNFFRLLPQLYAFQFEFEFVFHPVSVMTPKSIRLDSFCYCTIRGEKVYVALQFLIY